MPLYGTYPLSALPLHSHCTAPALFLLIHAALLHFDSKRSRMETLTDTVNAAAAATVAATASPSHSAAYQPVRHSVPFAAALTVSSSTQPGTEDQALSKGHNEVHYL